MYLKTKSSYKQNTQTNRNTNSENDCFVQQLSELTNDNNLTFSPREFFNWENTTSNYDKYKKESLDIKKYNNLIPLLNSLDEQMVYNIDDNINFSIYNIIDQNQNNSLSFSPREFFNWDNTESNEIQYKKESKDKVKDSNHLLKSNNQQNSYNINFTQNYNKIDPKIEEFSSQSKLYQHTKPSSESGICLKNISKKLGNNVNYSELTGNNIIKEKGFNNTLFRKKMFSRMKNRKILYTPAYLKNNNK